MCVLWPSRLGPCLRCPAPPGADLDVACATSSVSTRPLPFLRFAGLPAVWFARGVASPSMPCNVPEFATSRIINVDRWRCWPIVAEFVTLTKSRKKIDLATGRNPSRSRSFIEGGSAAGRWRTSTAFPWNDSYHAIVSIL
jgi:hypothetical protein